MFKEKMARSAGNQDVQEKNTIYDFILWGLFIALMYKIIFVEILNVNVFAMVVG